MHICIVYIFQFENALPEEMELVVDEICLRKWETKDKFDLVPLANNKKISDNLRDAFPYPYGIADAENWLQMVLAMEPPLRFFAITHKGQLAGSIGVVIKDDIYRKTAEIGYFVGEAFWGKKIMSRVIPLMCQYIFESFDVVRIFAEPFSNNMASRRVLEKSGFTHEATLHKNIIKNGVILDSCIYSIIK